MLTAEPPARQRNLPGRHVLQPADTAPAVPGRPCNLLLVCKRRFHEHDDFARIAGLIRGMAPDVHVRLISDRFRNAWRPDYWLRPTLAVSTEGLRWELDGDRLLAGSTRGVSNEMTAGRAVIRVARGTVLAVHVRRPEP